MIVLPFWHTNFWDILHFFPSFSCFFEKDMNKAIKLFAAIEISQYTAAVSQFMWWCTCRSYAITLKDRNAPGKRNSRDVASFVLHNLTAVIIKLEFSAIILKFQISVLAYKKYFTYLISFLRFSGFRKATTIWLFKKKQALLGPCFSLHLNILPWEQWLFLFLHDMTL